MAWRAGSRPHRVAARPVLEERRARLCQAVAAGRVKRVLAVRFARLGDVLFTTPALAQLHEALPGARIDYLTSGAGAALVESHPAVSQVHVAGSRQPRAWARVAAAGGYDLALVFESDRPTRNRLEQVLRDAGVEHVVSRSSLVGEGLRAPGRHSSQHHSDLLHMLGVEPDARPCQLFVAERDARWAEAWLAERDAADAAGAPRVVLQAGCHYSRLPAWLLRRAGLRHKFHKLWPEAHWQALARGLAEDLGARVVFTGLRAERPLAQRLAAGVAAPAPLLAAGETSVGQLAALLARAQLCISIDTGTMHIAAALGVPTLALFGPTRPSHHGPHAAPGVAQVLRSGVGCSPCDKATRRACPANRCMQELRPERVLEAAERRLSAGR